MPADLRPKWVQDLYRRIGNEIRKGRLNKNMTQEKLAQALGLSRPAVANIEKGAQGLDVFRLFEIAGILDLDAVELVRVAKTYRSDPPLEETPSGRRSPLGS